MQRPTVLVLGAGAAGLAAASALRRGGVRVVVLEARQRTGGRVDTHIDPALGVPLERGAEFIHGRPPLVWSLAREAGVRIREVPQHHRVTGRGAPPPRPSPPARGRAAKTRVSRSGDIFQRARDHESVAALLGRAMRERWAGEGELALARSFVEGFYLADPRTASAAAVARMDRALETIGGDRSYRAEGGWSSVLAPLEAEARRAPGELRLGVEAVRVRWRPGAAVVEGRGLAGGPVAPLRGDRLVVTLPVGVLAGVRFEPEPSAARAWRRLEMGPVVKVILRFRSPPWGRGSSPETFFHVPRAPVPVFWTLAPRRAPVLVGWAGGPAARRLSALGEAGALRAALRSLGAAFGIAPAALEDGLDGAELVDWSQDPLAGGGYAVFPVGSEGVAEELARPVSGTLFFAGEATEAGFAGTVDGALRSGERAARQVLESLGG